jgi:hypothetical protein
MTHTLPELTYPYDALEPYISQEIMVLHHTKHHQTYVNALNAAEASYAKAATPKERIALQAALKFNGGGSLTRFCCTTSRKMLIAIDQATLITPYSGRILRLPREMEVISRRDLLKLPLCTHLEASITSRRSSTPPLLESKDLDGAGSYVPQFLFLFYALTLLLGLQQYDKGA